MQGVFWHCCELVCRARELFPVRIDMTLMCLLCSPSCLSGAIDSIECWTLLSSRLSEHLKDWELLQGSVSAPACWVKSFLNQKCVLKSWALLSSSHNHSSYETSCFSERGFAAFTGCCFKGLGLFFWRCAWERALHYVLPFCFMYPCLIPDLSRLHSSSFHHFRFRTVVHVISI